MLRPTSIPSAWSPLSADTATNPSSSWAASISASSVKAVEMTCPGSFYATNVDGIRITSLRQHKQTHKTSTSLTTVAHRLSPLLYIRHRHATGIGPDAACHRQLLYLVPCRKAVSLCETFQAMAELRRRVASSAAAPMTGLDSRHKKEDPDKRSQYDVGLSASKMLRSRSVRFVYIMISA
jgi:hypothetical protein